MFKNFFLTKNSFKIEIEGPVTKDTLLVTMFDGSWCRASFVAEKPLQEFLLHLTDVGCEITVKIEDLFMIAEEGIEMELKRYPPRVFECSLAHVKPVYRGHDGSKMLEKMLRVFREHTLKEPAFVEVFSVVDSVVAVKLVLDQPKKQTNVNQKLIDKKYVEECEESYLSLIDNESRQTLSDGKVDPSEEFARKASGKSKLPCPPPPLSKCIKVIRLKGPESPLEVSLKSVSRLESLVSTDPNSVNSVIIEDDISNQQAKFYVACDLTVNTGNKNLVLRDVTEMPKTPGLAVLLALVFAPDAELRRDKNKSRYVESSPIF